MLPYCRHKNKYYEGGGFIIERQPLGLAARTPVRYALAILAAVAAQHQPYNGGLDQDYCLYAGSHGAVCVYGLCTARYRTRTTLLRPLREANTHGWTSCQVSQANNRNKSSGLVHIIPGTYLWNACVRTFRPATKPGYQINPLTKIPRLACTAC